MEYRLDGSVVEAGDDEIGAGKGGDGISRDTDPLRAKGFVLSRCGSRP